MGKLATLCAAGLMLASAVAGQVRPDWRRIGNASVDVSLSSVVTGSADRVWYSADGESLFAQVRSGRVFSTSDFETWKAAAEGAAVQPAQAAAARLPEPRARVLSAGRGRLYAFARFVWRSDDEGVSWTNLTAYRNQSIVGEGLFDLAISPSDDHDIALATASGVWRSADGGASWTGVNETLPNLPIRKIVSLPAEGRGARVALDAAPDAVAPVLEWFPGEKRAWRVSTRDEAEAELRLRQDLGAQLGAPLTVAVASGEFRYAGAADGRMWASSDSGRTWIPFRAADSGAVEKIWIDARDPRVALAATGWKPTDVFSARTSHVFRTLNGGAFWDDISSNLPDTAIHGVTADRVSGAVYAATDRGLFLSSVDLVNAAPAGSWTAIGGDLPTAPVMDAKLDANGNQLFVAIDGYGLYAAAAPHRLRDPRVVNAADYSTRPAAPGSLLSVLGSKISSARAGGVDFPVLASGESESQIQVPFDVRGDSLALSIESANGPLQFGVGLREASPAIFVDRDGTPMLLDADSGLMLDAMRPAHSNTRIQVLATGLGRVSPDWKAGAAAPADQPPAVIAPVRAYLDRSPVEVTRAVLAPYAGFYLIELELPKIVNYGPAELYIEVGAAGGGQASNRVRIYIEP
ncbi:MAG: hypothetical protein ABI823_11390 [Bryobacteraceae bacterium]